MFKRKQSNISEPPPEKTHYTKYYEHDGQLRAYANRSMLMAGLFGVIAFISLLFAIYVRLRAAVRKFLESYLRYTPTSVDKNFADALNMMTQNLRVYCLNQLRDQDLIGKIKDEQITSSFKIRSIEPIPSQSWTYQAFGVKEVHRIRNKSEFTDKIVGKYHVRLIQDRRSERVPSGLLVAEYREEQMVGEKDIGLLQESGLLDH
jgi:hypothetical protein